MHKTLKAIAVLFALLLPSLAVAQTQLPTLPPNTVLGRKAINAGPAQAIPFADLLDAIDTSSGPPFVILATGQSNFVQNLALNWSPSSNVYSWNFNGSTLFVDGAIGTSFVPLTSNFTTVIRQPEKFASDIGRAFPNRKVYVINISIGSQPITQWLPGASAPDMFANIVANMTPALAAIGVTKIDALIWWEGENQTAEPWKYVQDFNTLITRFQGQSWFPLNTPAVIYGIAPTSVSGDFQTDATNAKLQAAALANSNLRRFIYTASLGPTIWADTLHMTGAGHFAAGELASSEFLNGFTHQLTVDPLTGTQNNVSLGRPARRNLVAGGDFTVNPWRYGTSFSSVAAGKKILDNWTYESVGAGVVDILKTADAPTIAQAGQFTQHSLHVDVTTAVPSLSDSDYYGVQTTISGADASFLGFGQTNAKNLVVSFWVKATVPGNYFVAIENSAQNRSWNSQYTVDVADTWEKKYVSIRGDAAGTWLYTPGGVGLRAFFTIASGQAYLFTPDTWNAADVRVGNATRANGMSSTSNNFKLALVQIEEGLYPSAFDRVPAYGPSVPGVYVLGGSAVAVSLTGTTAETLLDTIPVPANMGVNSIVRVTTQWTFSGAGGNRTGRTKFGGTTFVETVATSVQFTGRAQGQIANRGVANSQVANAIGQSNFGSNTGTTVTAAIDTTSATSVTITGQLANSGDTMTRDSYLVELIVP